MSLGIALFTLVVGVLILGGYLYLDKKQGDQHKVFIPYIGFVNTRFWGGVATLLFCIYVIKR